MFEAGCPVPSFLLCSQVSPNVPPGDMVSRPSLLHHVTVCSPELCHSGSQCDPTRRDPQDEPKTFVLSLELLLLRFRFVPVLALNFCKAESFRFSSVKCTKKPALPSCLPGGPALHPELTETSSEVCRTFPGFLENKFFFFFFRCCCFFCFSKPILGQYRKFGNYIKKNREENPPQSLNPQVLMLTLMSW